MLKNKPKSSLYYLLVISILFCSCSEKEITEDTTKTVQVVYKNGKYQLLRHGKPYFIKGASGDGSLELLKNIGGNSIRTYTTENAENILDKADSLGLTVMLGIWIDPYNSNNDFSDSVENRKILRSIKRKVLRYKDHPALLMWGIGNEVHPINPNISSWKFLNKACKMVKQLDPNHPVTTSIAGYPRRNIPLMNMYLKNVDFVAFNTFGGINTFKEKMNSPIWGFDKAYILSEWGYHGYWSVNNTKWKSPMEPYSNSKAPRFKEIWTKYITKDSTKCFGGYVFYWGQKQEFTNSWYSLFSKNGEKTAIIDTLSSMWSGIKFKNHAPHIIKLKLNNDDQYDNLIIKNNSINTLHFNIQDAENDNLIVSSEIRHETSLRKDDYGVEREPLEIKDLIQKINNKSIDFRAPKEPGIYRIYINVSDGNGNCDMANLVFKVIKD